jgi:hypothetical protein
MSSLAYGSRQAERTRTCRPHSSASGIPAVALSSGATVLRVRVLRGTAATHDYYSISGRHSHFQGYGVSRRLLRRRVGSTLARHGARPRPTTPFAVDGRTTLGPLALVPAGIPGGEEHSHRLGGEPPCHEGQDPRRGSVESVGVVHDEQQRSGLGRHGQQNPQGGPAPRTWSRHILARPVTMAAPAGVTPHAAAGGPTIRPLGGRAP